MGMVPARADARARRVCLVHAGASRFSEPFFDISVANLLSGGARTLEMGSTELHRLVAPATAAPAGLVLHTGRCGSTLLMRMLSHNRAVFAVSEPSALGAVHWEGLTHPELSEHAEQLFADVLVVFDRFAADRGQRPLLKLSSWQATDCLAMLASMPAVPAVFVHRDVTEVVASQLHEGSPWVDALVGREPDVGDWADKFAGLPPGASRAELCAAMWASVVSAVLAAAVESGSRLLFVSHDDLVDRPEETLALVADHLGLGGPWRPRAVAELTYYAKSSNPAEKFDPGGRHARPALPDGCRERVLEIAGDLPDRLRARR
jgi:hypothetical protein